VRGNLNVIEFSVWQACETLCFCTAEHKTRLSGVPISEHTVTHELRPLYRSTDPYWGVCADRRQQGSRLPRKRLLPGSLTWEKRSATNCTDIWPAMFLYSSNLLRKKRMSVKRVKLKWHNYRLMLQSWVILVDWLCVTVNHNDINNLNNCTTVPQLFITHEPLLLRISYVGVVRNILNNKFISKTSEFIFMRPRTVVKGSL